jgi:apolipoprotein N-acyltransferase
MKIAKFSVTNIIIVGFSGFLNGFLPSFLPFAAIFFIIPFIALIYEEKPKYLKMYLWGFLSYFGAIWWMTLVNVKGLQPLIAACTVLLSATFALRYLFIAALSSFVVKKSKKFAFAFIPSVWIITEYLLLFGEFSFPWMLQGYSLSPYIYISQLASVTGVWGLSFLAVISAVILYERIFEKRNKIFSFALFIVIIIICVWGFFRVKTTEFYEEKALVMQPNSDQQNWQGRPSFKRSIEVLDSLFEESAKLNKGFYILPESGVYTYLEFKPSYRVIIDDWTQKYESPIIFGTLTPIIDADFNTISAHNSAYLADNEKHNAYENYGKYHKQKLVPFVETTPFKNVLPIINRMKFAGGGFTEGKENCVWQIADFSVAPLICYESIYPSYVRKRVNFGANLLVNLTNDGWFGRTSAPLQHAEMSRVRAIENGVSFIRCTNSGISFSADPYGRYLSKTKLYTREIVEMPIAKPLKYTIYRKLGDFLVYLCGFFTIFTLIFLIVRKK